MGGGLVFTECTIAAADRELMAGWHSHEHIRERVDVGVSTAARYVSLNDELHFCCTYRAPSAEVFETEAYASLPERASLLTMAILAGVKGTRCLGDIVTEVGLGEGGLLTRLRLPDWSDAAAQAFAAHVDVSGELGRLTVVHPRRHAPNVSDPNWVLLLQGAGTAAGLERAAAKIGREVGAATDPVELFRLEHLIH